MIKYIPGTAIGMLLCSISYSQHINVHDPSDIRFTENNSVNTIPLAKEGNWFDPAPAIETAIYVNASILYSGTVKRHLLHGNWQSWYSNQQLCDSGTFFKGMPVGEWKHWDINGQLLAIRNYNANKLLRIKDEIRRNQPKDAVYPLTALYKRNNNQGKYYMQAAYSFSFAGHHDKELSLQQAVENNTRPGNNYQPVFDECLHHGLYMNFYNNGTVKDSGYYKNGLRDGVWIHRDTDNSWLQGAYKNGIRQGDWKQYDIRSKLLCIVFYNRKGIEEWRKRFRE